jgi:hypothetical protein
VSPEISEGDGEIIFKHDYSILFGP